MNARTLLTIRGEAVRFDGEKITFDAGMTIDADGSPRAYHPVEGFGLDFLGNAGRPGNWWALACRKDGRPWEQDATDPCPGYYISTTAYERAGFRAEDPRRYLDSETVRFVVVPSQLRRLVQPVVLGCRAVVSCLGRTVEAVVGDLGPTTHLGEGSIALAAALGIPSDPKTGGVSHGVSYTIFPGVAAEGFELQPA